MFQFVNNVKSAKNQDKEMAKILKKVIGQCREQGLEEVEMDFFKKIGTEYQAETLVIRENKDKVLSFPLMEKGKVAFPHVNINAGYVRPTSVFTDQKLEISLFTRKQLRNEIKETAVFWKTILPVLKIPEIFGELKPDFARNFEEQAIQGLRYQQYVEELKGIIQNENSYTREDVLDKIAKTIANRYGVPKQVAKTDMETERICSEGLKQILKASKIPKEKYLPVIGATNGHLPLILTFEPDNDLVMVENVTGLLKDIIIPEILDSEDDSRLVLKTATPETGFLESFKDHPNRYRIVYRPVFYPPYSRELTPGGNDLSDLIPFAGKIAEMGMTVSPVFGPIVNDEFENEAEELESFLETVKTAFEKAPMKSFSVETLQMTETVKEQLMEMGPGIYIDDFIKSRSGKYIYQKMIRVKTITDFIQRVNNHGFEDVPRFLENETVETWKALRFNKYSDVRVELESFMNGDWL